MAFHLFLLSTKLSALASSSYISQLLLPSLLSSQPFLETNMVGMLTIVGQSTLQTLISLSLLKSIYQVCSEVSEITICINQGSIIFSNPCILPLHSNASHYFFRWNIFGFNSTKSSSATVSRPVAYSTHLHKYHLLDYI